MHILERNDLAHKRRFSRKQLANTPVTHAGVCCHWTAKLKMSLIGPIFPETRGFIFALHCRILKEPFEGHMAYPPVKRLLLD